VTTVEEISALTRPNHPDDWTDVDSVAVDTVRVLAADAVQKVGNGHPGTAMSLAPLAYTLFQRQMRHDPSDLHWLGRDRFVLSCGHSSLTLYIQLYLGGFGLELADLEALRTWGSKTPGHPEFRHTAGVEITTGPLGQGLASAVGMAMASRYERGLFDPDATPGTSPFDHFIYVIASDGDMEEGVTSEASSLAGTQQLGNLIVFYDHNQISIEHDTNIALSENVPDRYRAYGWHVQEIEGGENVVGIEAAIEEGHRQAVVHLGPHDHRLPGTHQDEHRRRTRLGAGRRRGGRHEEGPRFRPGQDLRGARRGHRAHPQAGGPRP
jgi:transketolase